ncbi:hypothetical protein DL98DRAFT_591387 [Cadophora sp. DSE1049]|nr:hypothetical protein DL98DRAFT_591387 [Cadophora sp. DSE1049]
MVHKHEVQGRIYRFKPQTTCLKLGITDSEISAIPSRIRSNLVLVLDSVKSRKGYVEVMGITPHTNATPPGTYLPISPTPKKDHALQIQLCNNQTDQSELVITRLPGRGERYLRVDERWEVPIRMLEGLVDGLGDEIRVRMKRRGGMGELGVWIRGWERERDEGKKEVEAVEQKREEGDTRKHAQGDERREEHVERLDLWTMVKEGFRWVLENLGRVLNPM